PELAVKHHVQKRPPQIVFEGKAPSDIKKNALLYRRLEDRGWTRDQSEKHAWLGEAMAIKDPTAVSFRTQTGSNVIMVGQHDEAGLATVATATVTLAAQHPPEESAFGARFYVLDGSPAEGQNANYLARVAGLLPHPIRAGGWREVAAYMFEL